MSKPNIITTTELKKAIDSLRTSIYLLKNSLSSSDNIEEQKAFRDACIQRFEYCIEFSWKTSMKILGSTTAAAKPAVREMARNNLINNPEVWLSFIDSRNETSHAYDEDVAKKVYAQIENFLPEAEKLLSTLDKQRI